MADDRRAEDLWLADNIRQRREAGGMSQSQLAAVMAERGYRWSQNTVYKVEAATRTVTGHELLALARLFETWPFELVNRPERNRENWAAQAAMARHEKNYAQVRDAVWTLRETQVELGEVLAHHGPHADPEVIRDVREAVAAQTVEAAVAEVDDGWADRERERAAVAAVRAEALQAEERRAREDAEAAQLARGEQEG